MKADEADLNRSSYVFSLVKIRSILKSGFYYFE